MLDELLNMQYTSKITRVLEAGSCPEPSVQSVGVQNIDSSTFAMEFKFVL